MTDQLFGCFEYSKVSFFRRLSVQDLSGKNDYHVKHIKVPRIKWIIINHEK